jgi:hypothetical protein
LIKFELNMVGICLNLLSENMREEVYINLFTARCGVKMFRDDGANEMSSHANFSLCDKFTCQGP